MRSKDRALHSPARLHSAAPAWWRRTAHGLRPDGCGVGAAFVSAHGRPRGPLTTLTDLRSIDFAGGSHDP
jgi:hypothetical protein